MAMRMVANHVSQRLLRTGGGTGSVRNISWSANPNSYQARAERLLKTEAETMKEGDPLIIKEFRKFKKTYEYDEKVHAESLANIHAADKLTGITIAGAIAAVAYYFSLTPSKPRIEERKLIRSLQRRANS
ncbi:hypothetical protein MKW92_023098 [Papaver armeniacum]|nr:hypothetical protein MKW92_023098 [Papaver armeniacum]